MMLRALGETLTGIEHHSLGVQPIAYPLYGLSYERKCFCANVDTKFSTLRAFQPSMMEEILIMSRHFVLPYMQRTAKGNGLKAVKVGELRGS
jgi:hypothetical protein